MAKVKTLISHYEPRHENCCEDPHFEFRSDVCSRCGHWHGTYSDDDDDFRPRCVTRNSEVAQELEYVQSLKKVPNEPKDPEVSNHVPCLKFDIRQEAIDTYC